MSRKKGKALGTEDLLAAGQAHAERGELAQAELLYRQALAKEPDHLGGLAMLGMLLVDREEYDAAIDLLERAREHAPEFAPLQLALGSAYAACGHDELAITAMEAAIKLDGESTFPMERLAKHHILARRPRAAIGLLRRVLRRDPAHAQAKFLLAGLTGEAAGANGEAPPDDLIADLFDTYAAKFEQHLTVGLEYSVPKALAALLVGLGEAPDGSRSVLDLGCGTGLAGAELRPFANRLVGCDLSPRMVTRSRARGIYDELRCESLAATLARETGVDLIVAADVLIYVGKLDETFAACARALRPGGLLAFSVERGESDLSLPTTLRYTHGDAYVRGVATAHAFTVERAEPSVLRIDNGAPVNGVLYVLRYSQ